MRLQGSSRPRHFSEWVFVIVNTGVKDHSVTYLGQDLERRERRKGSFMSSVVLILLGIGLLYLGGEFLVRFASSLAFRFRLSPLVIGLTVVAFGTSAPELAATMTAALGGSFAIAAGNVVGSNTANLGLILGLCVLLVPIGVTEGVLKRELPIMMLASALPLLWFMDGVMSRAESVVTFSLLLGYLFWTLRSPGEEGKELEVPAQREALWLTLMGIAGGLVLLVLGAQVLVEGATTLARALGVPERVIGLTLVAVGTSLPELASSLVAVAKRQTDMVLGNLIGSNIFNVLGILGLSSIVVPFQLTSASLSLDLYVMLAFGLATFLFLFTRRTLIRWEGLTLVVAYGAYVVWLF